MQGTTERFTTVGLDLNRPLDDIKPNRYPFLQNMRVTTQGELVPRFGLTDLGEVVSGQSPVHSIRRLNDPAAGLYTNIIGTGTHLAYGIDGGAYTDLDSGYSGNPLALMTYRPESATAAWMYCADSSRMRKVSRAGLLQTIGLAPPSAAPAANLSTSLNFKAVSEFNAAADWTQGGDAAAPSNQVRITTTIAQIAFDTGTTGWACISPTSFAAGSIGPGMRIVINTGGGTEETVTVEEVHPVAAATTIAAIIYDSGTSGAASIVLTTKVDLAQLNGLLRNSTIGENVRILAVTEGPDETTSIRVSTPTTWAAGNTVQILGSFRAYCVNTHAAAEAIDAAYVRTAITFSTGLATLTDTIALDLSIFSTTVPILPDDIMHISLRVDRPDRVTELKVLLDVDQTTNDFTRNFYSKIFRANDLTPSVRNQQSLISTRQQVIQRDIIDQTPVEASPVDAAQADQSVTGYENDYNADIPIGRDGYRATEIPLPDAAPADAVSQQLAAGDTQWVELFFPVSDLLRVGTDGSRSLQNVAATRIVATITGDVTLDIDSWHIRGGYGPDVSDLGSPYLYRYRARILGTNVASNPSPAQRGGVTARRQSVTVSPTQYAAPSGTNLTAATDLVLDVERFGGLVPEWHYVGTCSNAASPSFTDTFPDETVIKNDQLGESNFQPWPLIQAPASGTTGTVAGTTVNDAATNFNTSWAPGTQIRINNTVYTIYRVISTSRLELVENAGSQSAVAWEIPEPVLLGQPLPCLWGDEEFGAAFACGDTANPGRLYCSNPFAPDSTIEANYLDITSTSEPLQNGLIWNGRSYVYSSERCFEILPDASSTPPYRAIEVPGTEGLFSRWGLSRNPSTPAMFTLAKDGINHNSGDIAKSLTDDDLSPLFPYEGNLGSTVNTIVPPNIVSAQAANLRLEYYDHYLYFDYINTSSVYRSLIFDRATGGWFYDVYTPTIKMRYGCEGSGVHQILCGGTDGHLYRYEGTSDDSTNIDCVFETPSRDQSAARIQKYYEDCMLDCNPNGVTVTITPGVNNRATTYAAVTDASASRSQIIVPLGSASQTARNISLRVSFAYNGTKPSFYLWEPRFAPENAPLIAKRWSVSPQHYGMPNYKHIGDSKITHVSSADLSLLVTLDGTAQTVITIPHSSGAYSEYYFRLPVMKGRLIAFDLYSSTDFRIAPSETWFNLGEWDRGNERYRPIAVFQES